MKTRRFVTCVSLVLIALVLTPIVNSFASKWKYNEAPMLAELVKQGKLPTIDPWIVKTHSLEEYNPTYLGNGYMGLNIYQLGRDTPEGDPWTYVNGVFTKEYYLPPTGDSRCRLVNIPSFFSFTFNEGMTNLLLNEGEICSYEQSLDLYNGVMNTKFSWKVYNKVTDFNIIAFVCRDFLHGAVIHVRFTPHYSDIVTITSCLDGSFNPYEYKELKKGFRSEDDSINLSVQTKNGIEIVESSIIQLSPTLDIEKKAFDNKTVAKISEKISFPVNENEKYEFTKYTCVYTSLDLNDPMVSAQEGVKEMSKAGFSSLYQAHKKAWNELWKTDIVVEGEPEIQQIVHSFMFYLLESLCEENQWSVGPGGLGSHGWGGMWGGRVFWDAETWVFPALLLTHPEMAKSIAVYRYNTLEGARQGAEKFGYKGARYPWQSAVTGREETSADFRNHQEHITGDVAFAQWLYWLVTQDKHWLEEKGYPVISECCKYWESRVTYNPKLDKYEIRNASGPDEYHRYEGGTNNSAFTNAIAKKTLETGIAISRLLDMPYPKNWEEIASKLYMPFNESSTIIPESDEYRGDMIKQADVVLLFYPLGLYADNPQIILDNLEYYAARTDPKGPAMSDCIHSILYAQLQKHLQAYEYFLSNFCTRLYPPFNQLSEKPDNKKYPFFTGMGGVLQSVIYGFGGLRITEEGLSINPCLPKGVEKFGTEEFLLAR
jgi:trehalose/maltose hydrolase-like predicted phosphorylase